MTHSVMLRMIVAMEAALADGRFEEAARVRDEYRRAAAAGADKDGLQQAAEGMPADSNSKAY